MDGPRIDVGLPVFNGAESIDRTIESVRSQTYDNFRLVISDNASTDGTRALAERHVAEDGRVALVVQSTNLGAYGNYKSLAERSGSEFFALIAADDWWSPTFLEATLEPLLTDPAAVCCVPRTAFYTDAGACRFVSASTFSLTDARAIDRALRFLVHPSDCSRFYGLHRRAAFAASFDCDLSFHAADWYVVLLEILQGLHLEVPQVLLHRSAPPLDRYVRHWRQENGGFLRTRTPLEQLRKQLKGRLAADEYRAIRGALARLDARLGAEHRAVERASRALSR